VKLGIKEDEDGDDDDGSVGFLSSSSPSLKAVMTTGEELLEGRWRGLGVRRGRRLPKMALKECIGKPKLYIVVIISTNNVYIVHYTVKI